MRMDSSDYLVFRVGEDRFGIPVSEVNTVERTSEIRNVEILPPNVGVASLQHGLVITLDLTGALLGKQAKPNRRTVILTTIDEKTVGFEVEEVVDIVKYSKGSAQTLDQLTDNLPFVDGIVSDEKTPVILVDGKKLISFVSGETIDSHISQLNNID